MINNAENIDITHRAVLVHNVYTPAESTTEDNSTNNDRDKSDYYKDVLTVLNNGRKYFSDVLARRQVVSKPKSPPQA